MVREHIYRVGSHWRGRTIILQGCEPPDEDGRRVDDQLVAHVDSSAPRFFAEKVCALLSEPPACNCGHEGLHPVFHLGLCPVAVLRPLARMLGYVLAPMPADAAPPASDGAAMPADAGIDGVRRSMARLRSVFLADADAGFTGVQAMAIVLATMTEQQ